MIAITTQKQAREVRQLPFCYLCGSPLAWSDSTDEHVIARTLIHEEDRTFPLILPSHEKCNKAQSEADEAMGQLIQMLHTDNGLQHKLKLTGYYSGSDIKMAAVKGVPLEPIIWRWIRGMHAALYREPLIDRPGTYGIMPPLPEFQIENGSPKIEAVLPQYFKFTSELIRNRTARNVDHVDCYNGKFRYECIWVKADCGQPMCLFAVNLYNWSILADEYPGPKRGCVGSYVADRIPPGASVGTSLIFEYRGAGGLDPFSFPAGETNLG